MFELGDGVLWGDFWFLGFAAEEGGDVEAGEGFDFVAVAFAGLDFGWDWGDFALDLKR